MGSDGEESKRGEGEFHDEEEDGGLLSWLEVFELVDEYTCELSALYIAFSFATISAKSRRNLRAASGSSVFCECSKAKSGTTILLGVFRLRLGLLNWPQRGGRRADANCAHADLLQISPKDRFVSMSGRHKFMRRTQAQLEENSARRCRIVDDPGAAELSKITRDPGPTSGTKLEITVRHPCIATTKVRARCRQGRSAKRSRMAWTGRPQREFVCTHHSMVDIC